MEEMDFNILSILLEGFASEGIDGSGQVMVKNKRTRVRKLEPVLHFGLHPSPLDVNKASWKDWRCAIAYSDSVNSQKQALLMDETLFQDYCDRQKQFSVMVKRYFKGLKTLDISMTASEVNASNFVNRTCDGDVSNARNIVSKYIFVRVAHIFSHSYHMETGSHRGVKATQFAFVLTAYTHWGKRMSEKFSWSQLKSLILSSESLGGQIDGQLEAFCCGGAIKVADKHYDIQKLFTVATGGQNDCLFEQILSEQRAKNDGSYATTELTPQKVTTPVIY